uniref:Uncharacterized protein n=1 Tax=Kwoniella pini CBS 10737 TaxID=1296096 RepID=A0A1B9I1F8_9TREE|nr:uncharacterized protein I206_05073 [Kwoniella pini CBS 10737]OCF49380.1 hypothetical protein I206_05073 [Kwoniella pini CBS 10737]
MSDTSGWIENSKGLVVDTAQIIARSGHYGLSDTVVRNAGIAANVAAAFSLATTLGFLSCSIWIYSYSNCRHTLDRISFRLLVIAMFWEFWYSFNFLLLFINDTIYLPGHSLGPKHCTAGVYFLVSAMSVVDFLIMFIALNLFLTINMGINPVQFRYMIPLASAIKEHFGWDYALGTCWINGSGNHTRLKYLIEGIYITPIITCTISTICVTAVLIVLFRQGKATSKALFGGIGGKQEISSDEEDIGCGLMIGNLSLGPLSASSGSGSGSDQRSSSLNLMSNSSGSPNSNTTITTTTTNGDLEKDEGEKVKVKYGIPILWKLKDEMNNFAHGKGWRTSKEIHSKQGESYFNSLSDKFLGIAIKIAWYPITLLFVNAILMIGDLVIAARGGAKSQKTIWLYCVYYFFYGGRGICIAGLAIIIDPSLVRGMKAAWRERKSRKNQDILPAITQSSPLESTLSPALHGRTQLSTTLNSSPSNVGQTVSMPIMRRGSSDRSFDFASALAYIPKPAQASQRNFIQNPTATLPVLELDESYLNQELDTAILDNPSPQEIGVPTDQRSLMRSSTLTSISTAKKTVLSFIPTPTAPTSTYRPVIGGGGGGGRTKMRVREQKSLDPEILRRREEQRRRQERVKEIKKKFEEVQKHL